MHFGRESETNIEYTINDLVSRKRVPLEASKCDKNLGLYNFITYNVRFEMENAHRNNNDKIQHNSRHAGQDIRK